MSSRSKNNLTWRQERFLNQLVLGKSTEQVMRDSGIKPSTLRRWNTQSNFVAHWENCIAFLALRRRTDEQLAGPIAPSPQLAPTPSHSPPQPALNPNTPVVIVNPQITHLKAPLPGSPPASPAKPPMSERECIRTRHGEEAARAFDRLMQDRRALKSTQPAPAATSPPPPAPSSPTPTPQGPAPPPA